MPQVPLFTKESARALRQPKTDRLIIGRLLRDAARTFSLEDDDVAAAHAVLVKWADMETSGRLAKFSETQLQGDFLAQVFGAALGYAQPTENADVWHQEQHRVIAGNTPDAVLGRFTQGEKAPPIAVVELKGPENHPDRDRSNGRTAVDQCWDYLVNTPPTCRWGIVSNMISFRLYERDSTKRAYEHFTLQGLRDRDEFRRFYLLFRRQGLIEGTAREQPLALRLLKQTNERQREVGKTLFDSYSENRIELVRHLKTVGHEPDAAIEMAQRLLDRVIFIAFCEDRQLLPEKSIATARGVSGFHDVTNPAWQQFKRLFGFIKDGNEKYHIPAYNSDLFAKHPVDELELPDDPWTNFFNTIGEYDFSDEVNLDVLGHLFERSITELEKYKETGIFNLRDDRRREFAAMPQSVKRKQLGIYYTPPELTSRIVQYTVDELIAERFAAAAVEFGVAPEEARRGIVPDDADYWHRCLTILQELKIVDPACGSGAFLFQAYNTLELRYHEVVARLEAFGEKGSFGEGASFPRRRESSEKATGADKPIPPAASFPERVVPPARHSLAGGNPAIRHDPPPVIPSNDPLDSRLRGNDGDDLFAQIPHWILGRNLYGVDLSPEAVEITQLALWIRSASRGQKLEKLSRNIVHGNSLVHDPALHAAGFNWREKFPEVFTRGAAKSPMEARRISEGTPPNDADSPLADASGFHSSSGGFDCVIGNPPWERIKLQEREFFSLPAPEIATATNAAKRRQLVAKLEAAKPDSDEGAIYKRYQAALASADALLSYCRQSEQYPLTGRGDINLYAVFAELAYQIVAPSGRVGLLTPSGIATDMTTKDFFAAIAESNRLIRLYDFENRTKKFFPDVDGRFKFCILNFGGAGVTHEAADFVFFAHKVEELEDPARHVPLSGADIKLLNPNTRTCPIFRSKRDAEITKAVYRRVPVLIDEARTGPTGNPWGITFKRMFDQTNDAELFREAETLKADKFKLAGNRWVKGKQTYLPLYEAKMVQVYDHRAADVVTDEGNWVRQGQTEKTSQVKWQNPEHLATPRFWIDAEKVELPPWGSLGFKDITSPTNQRTMIAACGPLAGYTNHFVLVRSELTAREQTCLLANLNSFAYDYCTRQKIGGVTLNFFIVEQLPTLTPDTYQKPCPWAEEKGTGAIKKGSCPPPVTLETWISERVLKLTCTAEDMLPLADACAFSAGSFQKEYGGRLNKWDEAERATLLAELDAAFFHLYGLSRDDAEYILSTFKGIHDRTTLLPGHLSIAEHVLAEYDRIRT